MKALLRRLSRYAAVSVISTTVTLSLLGLSRLYQDLVPGLGQRRGHGGWYGAVVRAEPALGLG